MSQLSLSEPVYVSRLNTPNSITYRAADLHTHRVCAIALPTNSAAHKYRGLLRSFADRYPYNQEIFASACQHRHVEIGDVVSVKTDDDQLCSMAPSYIINVPVKASWDSPLTLPNLTRGLESLVDEVKRLELNSIADLG